MKKINTEVLLKLISEGKSGREISRLLGVSDSAICQAKKRLTPPSMPESFSKLTAKEQVFVMNMAQGQTRINSAMNSFECTSRDSAKSLAYNLMQKPEITNAIEILMENVGLTKQYRIKKLKTHVDSGSADISLKALDQSWKLDGSYAPEKSLNLSLNVNVSDEELQNLQELLKVAKEKYVAAVHERGNGQDERSD